MAGEKDAKAVSTHVQDSKGGTVVKSIYDYVDTEKLSKTRKQTQEQLQSRANDFTPFDKAKNNLNLSLLARHAAYNEELSKKLQDKFPTEYAELQKEVSKYTNAQDKNKAAEEYQKKHPGFYIDQRKVFIDDAEYDDYVKVRNYTDEAHGYKSLGTDVYADKYASRMATQDVNPSQSVSADNFIQTTREADEYNKTHKESFNTRTKYDRKTKSYDMIFEDQRVQDRIETRPIPNPQSSSIGLAGLQEGKIDEMNAAKVEADRKAALAKAKSEADAIKTNTLPDGAASTISTKATAPIEKKRKGTDNTIPKKSFEEYYKTIPKDKNDTITYNLRDAYKELPDSTMTKFATGSQHLPDTYKTPKHITFSNESKYSTKEIPGGSWETENGQDVFKAADINVESGKRYGGIDKYFKEYEKGVKLVLPEKKRKGTDNTIPKLANGTQGLTGDQYAGLAAGTAQIAGGVVNATDTQKNGKKSVGGAALTGAASGAAMGTSIMPGWGTAIGGVVGGAAGGISAAIGNKKIDKQMAAQAVKDAEAKKLAMFTPMKNTQAPMYKKGTAGAVNNKLVEVEKDEVVLRKGVDGSFTKVADFKGGKSHERGGEDYILKAGDVVFPGHKRDLINSYLSKRDSAAIDRERQKLPKEVLPKLVVGVDFSTTPKVGKYGFNTEDEEGLPTTTNAKLQMKTPVPLPSTTTLATRSATPNPTKEALKGDKANWWNAVDYAQPVANIIQGMGAPEKTTRRYITPEEIAYKDQSAGVRQEAAIADRIRRGNTTTSAQQNRAIANASSAMKSKDVQNIGAQESARADQIAAMNVGIRNQGKQQNLELANRYDEQDLQNKAVVDAYTQQGLFDLTRVAQQQRRDKALDKSQDIMLKSLASNNFQYTGDDGVKYIKDSTGKYVNATTGKAKPNNVSVSS